MIGRSRGNNQANRGVPPAVVRGRKEPFDACQDWYALADKELRFFSQVGKTGFIIPPGWKAKAPPIYADAENKRRLHCFEKTGKDGRVYEVMIDKRNNIDTFKVRGTPEDKKQGMVGTDGCAVVKILRKNSYDFIKVDDLIDRQKLIFDAAVSVVNKNYEHGFIDKDKRDGLLAEFGEREKKQYVAIRELYDFQDSKNSIRTAPSEESAEAFKAKCKEITAGFEKSIRAAATDISQAMTKKKPTDKDVNNMARELMNEEGEIIVLRGRPLIIKVGEVGEKTKMMSAQMPLGEKTLPSTHRDGTDKVTQLSNHVTDITASFNNDTQKFDLALAIDGHSSYCPINQKNDNLKMLYAYQAVKEKVRLLVEKKMQSHPGQIPVEIDMATMMLLSPLLGKVLDEKVRGSESEHRQLEISRLALNMLQNEEPLKIKVNGREVPVTFRSISMNKPVNMTQKQMNKFENDLQKHVNARGFMDFKEKVHARVENHPVYAGTNGKVVAKELNDYYNKKKDIESDPRVIEIREKLGVDGAINSDLKAAYDALRKSLSKYEELYATKTFDDPELNIAAGECVMYEDTIRKLEEQKGALLYKIENIYRQQYRSSELKSGSREENLLLQKKLMEVIKVTADPVLKKELITQLRYLRAEDLHYGDTSNLSSDTAYQFHVNYLLANYSLDYIIEAFCKSAEDRTGFLRVSLMAEIAFEKETGCPPDFSNPEEKKRYQEIFAAKSLELSASLENTKENSEARGLNVKAAMTLPNFNMAAGKSVSLMAKPPYKKFMPSKMQKFKNSGAMKLQNMVADVSSILKRSSSSSITRRPNYSRGASKNSSLNNSRISFGTGSSDNLTNSMPVNEGGNQPDASKNNAVESPTVPSSRSRSDHNRLAPVKPDKVDKDDDEENTDVYRLRL